MSLTRRFRELVLWAGAALGLLAVAAGLAVAFGGFSFLIFRSGSMSPEIPTGGIALSRSVDAADIRPGDVVSVTAANGERITHRVVETTVRGDEASLILKGDANATEDSEVYVVPSAERVVGSLPYGGYVLVHALTPPGLLAMGCLSLMLIVLSAGAPQGPTTPPAAGGKPRHRDRRRAHASHRVVAVLVVAGALAGTGATVAHTSGTWATFTDDARVTSGSFSATTVRPPTAVGCSTNGGTYIRWTAPTSGPTPSGYRVSYTWNGNNDTDDVGAGVFQYRPPGAGFLGSRTYTVTVAALVGTNWVSVTSTTSDSIRAAGFFGNTYTCP